MSRMNQVTTATAAALAGTFEAFAFESVTFIAKGLGAAETIDVKVGVGSSWETLRDIDGNAITFTGSGGTPANRNMFTVEGGLIVQFTGTVAGTVEIWACPGRGINS